MWTLIGLPHLSGQRRTTESVLTISESR
jgi:hypothetical protein